MNHNRAIDVSVVICTWNRASLLNRCLYSFSNLNLPNDFCWELIIVDNNSTDSTAEVIESFKQQLPIQLIFEKRQGLSIARNTGLRNCQGKLVLFTDDDVIVDPLWISVFHNSFLTHPDIDFFGGTIIPKIDFPLQHHPYLKESIFDGILMRKTLNPENPFILGEDLPFGANMGFRRSSLGTLTFSEHLGLKGKDQIKAEEIDLINRLKKQNGRGLWVPQAVVHHLTSKNRLRPLYLWRYFVGLGRTEVRLQGRQLKEISIPWGEPWRLFLSYVAIWWGRRIELNRP
jgi:glycosyltransferase involved in cell wall biosynthesis